MKSSRFIGGLFYVAICVDKFRSIEFFGQHFIPKSGEESIVNMLFIIAAMMCYMIFTKDK